MSPRQDVGRHQGVGRGQGAPVLPAERRAGADLGAAAMGLLLVVLTVGALFAAGHTDRATGPHAEAASRLEVGPRSFTCTGGLPGATATVGSLAGGPVTVDGRPAPSRSFTLTRPVQVLADRNAARSAYAAQAASDPRWFAAASCPEPRATWWFVGAGASANHDTVLTVGNPRPGTAIFDVDVLGPHRPVDAPDLHGLTLASHATRTLDLGRMAPASGDLAVRVRASRGLVSAAAAETWSPTILARSVREWVAPQPAPARQLDLAGLPAADSSTLLVANPHDREAVVGLRVVSRSGTFRPTRHASLQVPAASVTAVDVSDVIDDSSAAIRLSSTLSVSATVRSVRGSEEAYASSVGPLVGTSAVAMPQAAQAQLVLVSVGPSGAPSGAPSGGAGAGQAPARVSVQEVAGGRELGSRAVAVPAGRAATVDLSRTADAIAVSASGGDVAASLVLRTRTGFAAVPVTPAVTAQRRPGVLPAW